MTATQTELSTKARRILERFPAFMEPLGPHKLLARVVSAAAAPLQELDTAMHMVLESHWVERAGGDDLERIGALFALARLEGENPAQYRFRLTRLVRNFLQYGSTPRGVIEAAAAAIGAELDREPSGRAKIAVRGDVPVRHATILGGPASGMRLELEETPHQVRLKIAPRIIAGTRISVTNQGFGPAAVTITVAPAEESAVINPGVVNLTGDWGVRYRGEIQPGQRVRFSAASAWLRTQDGQETDVSTQANWFRGALADGAIFAGLQSARAGSTFYRDDPQLLPGLPEGESIWAYAAAAGAARVEFSWPERTRASFAVRLPASLGQAALQRATVAVERVRAAGVKAIVESYEV